MTGEQIQAPSSPRDGEDVAITIGRPKVILHSNIFLPSVWKFIALILDNDEN